MRDMGITGIMSGILVVGLASAGARAEETATPKEETAAPKKVAKRVPIAGVESQAVLDYAATALGKKYVWGGTTWSSSKETMGKGKGPDCSGLVLKAWRFPKPLKTSEPLPRSEKWSIGGVKVQPRQDTRTMYAGKHENTMLPWRSFKDFAKAAPADALVWKGHTMLVWSRDKKTGSIKTIEAIGGEYKKTMHLVRTTAFLKRKSTKLLKRDNLNVDTPDLDEDLGNERSEAIDPAKEGAATEARTAQPSPRPRPSATASGATLDSTTMAVRYHTLREGDTLWAIARRYGVTMNHVRRLNPGLDMWTKLVGSKIRVR